MSDSTSVQFSKEAFLQRIETSWQNLTTYLDSLTEEQLTVPTDAAGWTAKDHIIHIAIWERGTQALLNRQPRQQAMEIDEAVWATHDDDTINAAIQERYRDMPLDEVMQTFRKTHADVVAKITSLSTEDLERPYSYYNAESERTEPVWRWIEGDTIGHYDDHKPWIDAIVEAG